jgi:hypothetical protein
MWTCHAVSKGHDIVSFLVSILDFSICSPVEGLFNWQVCHSEHSLTIVSALCPVSGTAELRAGTSIPSAPDAVYLHQDKIQSGYLIAIP